MSNITIQFMGTGSSFSKKHGNTSALVFVEKDGEVKKILIDCGRTTPDDMAEHGYGFGDIDAIFITHLHGDHVYGLEEAGFIGRYVLNKKPHLIFPSVKIKNDLWDKVLKGTMAQGDLVRAMSFEDYFTHEVVDREDQYFFFNDVMFSVFPTNHIKNKKSYGLIIGERNYILYSGDSLFNNDLVGIGFSEDCQAVFHDCQLFESDSKVHASLGDLLTIDEQYRGSVFIMHYGDDLHGNWDKIDEIKDSGLNIAIRGEKYEFEVGEF